MFRALIAAARVSGMLQDPAVLTASKWQDWLHPRGKDGRFIEKGKFVNVFANPNALLADKTAVRRRARINELRPEGAYVSYQDINGHPLPPDPDAGFPDMIPVSDLSQKISTAPQAIAQLQPQESAAKEVKDALMPAMSRDDWEADIKTLSDGLAEAHPEQSAVVSTGQAAIDDQDFLDHQKYVTLVNKMGMHGPGQSLALDGALKDSFGMWSEEMRQIFEGLVGEAYNDLTDNQTKPRDQRAIVLGGLPGAGKSSTLKTMSDAKVFSPDDWIITNPDYFKDVIIAKGLAPQIHGLAPAETASFIHEASSEMTHMLEQLLTVEGYNVIFDITLGNSYWAGQTVDRLESLDYSIDGIFVDVPPTTARNRAQARHRMGLNALRTGTSRRPDDPEIHNGGRVVPEAVLTAAQLPEDDPDAQTYNSANARNFDQITGKFARWAVWDNSGAAPEFVDGSGIGPDDPQSLPGYYPPSSPDSPTVPSGPVGAAA
jgi:chloramphenicol 3-O-phosphotransferase